MFALYPVSSMLLACTVLFPCEGTGITIGVRHTNVFETAMGFDLVGNGYVEKCQ